MQINKLKEDTDLMKIYFPKGSDSPIMEINYDEALSPIIGEREVKEGQSIEELRDYSVVSYTAAFLGILINSAAEKYGKPVSLYVEAIIECLAASVRGKDPKTANRILDASLKRRDMDRYLAEANIKVKDSTLKN